MIAMEIVTFLKLEKWFNLVYVDKLLSQIGPFLLRLKLYHTTFLLWKTKCSLVRSVNHRGPDTNTSLKYTVRTRQMWNQC